MSVMQSSTQDVVQWYARRHLSTDPGIRAVYYLPMGSPDREIRFLEVNDLMAERENDSLEPIDFGIDVSGAQPHKLLVLDVTPGQWEQIRGGTRALPPGWSLDGLTEFRRDA
jgi:hypothetical protein